MLRGMDQAQPEPNLSLSHLPEVMKDSLDRIGRESLAEDMQATLWNTVFYITEGKQPDKSTTTMLRYVRMTMANLSQ